MVYDVVLLCCCMQMTAKLAALSIQALQRPNKPLAAYLVFNALNAWLTKAIALMQASSGSRAAAAVRQQLQDSQLLQHLGPAMDAAAAQLTGAAAALATVTAATSGSSGCSSSTAVTSSMQHDSIQKHMFRYEKADEHCGLLLKAFQLTSKALSQQACCGLEAGLPAAPAAMRLILTGLQACSKLQQLSQQKEVQVPLQFGKSAAVSSSFVSRYHCLGLTMPALMYSDALVSTPAAKQLLLLPEYMSCLALVIVATMLGIDMSSDDDASAAATPAAISSSAPGVGRRTGRHSAAAELQQQQQRGNSSGGGGSSSSTSGSSSGGSSCSSGSGTGVSSGMRQDSLTPLSCGLFDILGVTEETVL